jgi:hypothetical protein
MHDNMHTLSHSDAAKAQPELTQVAKVLLTPITDCFKLTTMIPSKEVKVLPLMIRPYRPRFSLEGESHSFKRCDPRLLKDDRAVFVVNHQLYTDMAP